MGTRVAVVSSVHRWNDTRVYLKQAKSLVRAGYDVLLVAVCAEPREFERDGLRVQPLPRRSRALRWLNWLAILGAIIRHRAKIVHAHDPELFPLLALLRLGGRRVVCDVHEDLAEQILHKEWIPKTFRKGLSWGIRVAQKRLPRVTDAVILAEDSYARNFPNASNVTIVRNFPMLPAVFKDDYRSEKLRLVYVGDVRVVRGIESCIRLTRKLLDEEVPAELIIVGSFADSEEERCMRELVEDLMLSPHVNWLGRRPPEEIPTLLRGCDIGLALLYPIGNYRESYPTKMFEYMAAGLPVVVSNFTLWEAVVVGNRCGRVVDPLDIEAAASILCEYWMKPELRQEHGSNGRSAVKEFYDWDVEFDRMMKVYDRLKC